MSDTSACWFLHAWPDIDRALWLAAMEPKSLLDATGPASRWRAHTKIISADGYGRALAWLARSHFLDLNASPDLRWSMCRIEAYVAWMQDRVSSATVKMRLVALERALAAMLPRSNRELLKIAISRIPVHPDYARKRKRLQEPARLVDLGLRLMEEAERGPNTSVRKNAAQYRAGLQIALLAMRPLRLRNFASITSGVHLISDAGRWWLQFEAQETKGGRQIEVPFPAELVPALERYLSYHRPLLTAGHYRGDRLWIGYAFKPMAAHTINLSFVKWTQREFGQPINPHLFRDCAATSIAIHEPEHVGIIAIILGHANLRTSERHYNLARALEAGRSYAAVLKARRAALKNTGGTRRSGKPAVGSGRLEVRSAIR